MAVASVIIAVFLVATMIVIDIAASGISITKVCVVWAKVIILKVAIVKLISQVVAVWGADMEKLLPQPCDLHGFRLRLWEALINTIKCLQ